MEFEKSAAVTRSRGEWKCINYSSTAVMKHYDQGTLKKKVFVWVSEGGSLWLSQWKTRQPAWRHLAGAVPESSHLHPHIGCRGGSGGENKSFENSMPGPSDTPSPTRPHPLSLPPKSSTNWESNIEIYEPLGPFPFQLPQWDPEF